MNNMKKIYTTIIISFITLYSFGQIGTPQNFMRSNPYFASDNPARFTPYNGYVGLPILSNSNVSFTNSSFNFKTISNNSEKGEMTLNVDNFLNQLKKNNYLNLNINEEILGFGFRVNKLFFAFSYGIKADAYFRFSKDLFAFPINGPSSYIGEDNKTDINLNLNINAYQEVAISVQTEITPRLSLGFRPKLLFGIMNANTRELNASIMKNPVDNCIYADYAADATIYAAFPLQIVDGKKISLDFGVPHFQNLGFALDMGGVFKINEKMGVGLAVSNLGFVKWKGNGININGSLPNTNLGNVDAFFLQGFSPEDLTSLIEVPDDSDGFLDSIKNIFATNLEYVQGKATMLNAKIAAEFYYEINPNHRFTAVVQGVVIGKDFAPALTLAYNGKLAKVFDLYASYSMMPRSYGNLGMGVGFDLWPVYLYVATNNIIGAFTPLKSNYFSVSAGLVFKWGKATESELSLKQ